MLTSLFTSPKVEVVVEEEDLYVHPRSGGLPTSDPILRGTALVSLPSARKVKRVRVLLQGLCDQWGGSGTTYEIGKETLHKELKQEMDETFEAGEHAFNFAFIIPSSTPVSERCVYGRTRHYVKAMVEFEGGLLDSSISSSLVGVWIIPNPLPPGELPLPTNLTIEKFSEDLGALAFNFSSPHLTISAICHVQVSLLGPPIPVTINSISIFLQQSFAIHYSKTGQVVHPPPQQHRLLRVDDGTPSPRPSSPAPTPSRTDSLSPSRNSSTSRSRDRRTLRTSAPSSRSSSPSRSRSTTRSDEKKDPLWRGHDTAAAALDPFPLCNLDATEALTYSRICRVPNDNFVRPSTLEGSDSTIRVSHEIVVEVKYEKEGGNGVDLTERISRPLEIVSCCCLLDALTLPSYSSAPPATVLRPLDNFCQCHVSTSSMVDLVADDGEPFTRSTELHPPTSTPRTIGGAAKELERANKTPAYNAGRQYVPRKGEGE